MGILWSRRGRPTICFGGKSTERKRNKKNFEKRTKDEDGTCGDGELLSLRFVLHHQHTQVETRDNHPLPDSPPSISSHGGTKKKKRENKTQAAEPLSLPVLVALAPMLSSTTYCLPYIKLSHSFFFFLPVFSNFTVFFFSFLPHQLTNRPALIYFLIVG